MIHADELLMADLPNEQAKERKRCEVGGDSKLVARPGDYRSCLG